MTPPGNQDLEPECDERATCLGNLMWALQGLQFTAEIHGEALKLSSPDRPAHVVEVRCARRAADDGRLWFVAGGRPVAEADNITFALTAIKELTAVRM